MNLVLVRDPAGADCTLGVLAASALTLQTLELSWVPIPGATCGHPDRSCVPEGDYTLALHNTPRHPRTFALVNPDLGIYHQPGDIPAGRVARCSVLMHVGNYPHDSLGCILLGRGRATAGGLPMITSSGAAMVAFRAAVPWIAGHTLSIRSKSSAEL